MPIKILNAVLASARAPTSHRTPTFCATFFRPLQAASVESAVIFSAKRGQNKSAEQDPIQTTQGVRCPRRGVLSPLSHYFGSRTSPNRTASSDQHTNLTAIKNKNDNTCHSRIVWGNFDLRAEPISYQKSMDRTNGG